MPELSVDYQMLDKWGANLGELCLTTSIIISAYTILGISETAVLDKSIPLASVDEMIDYRFCRSDFPKSRPILLDHSICGIQMKSPDMDVSCRMRIVKYRI